MLTRKNRPVVGPSGTIDNVHCVQVMMSGHDNLIRKHILENVIMLLENNLPTTIF